ncbi:MAG: sulfur oxidation c-type cytochrome SoxX [Caldimonas sp.]
MMTFKHPLTLTGLAVAATFVVSGCAAPKAPGPDYDKMALAMMKSSFRAQGQAHMDRIEQDAVQDACSDAQPPSPEVTKKLEAEQLATIKAPASGHYIGDWKKGEKLAENGRGMTWSDDAKAANGGNCYNCHELSKAQISYGTLGPSLYHYGKLRGVANPADPAAMPIVQYTWAKIYNAKAYNACSGMPRFGHAKVLDEKQMQDLMAYLLDPKSPVNQ